MRTPPFRVLNSTAAFLLLACGETVEVPNATFGNETGSYETGYTIVDVGSGLLEPGECVAAERS